jgi:hypothetical protein
LIQEYSENELKGQKGSAVNPNPPIMGGKMVSTLQLAITVEDPTLLNKKGKPLTYSGTLIELFQLRNQGRIKIGGIIQLNN